MYSKKVFLLAFSLIVFSFNLSFGQLSQVVSGASIYAPPSPNASALLRYANVPVDEHTGIASVVLPIDQLAGRQLSVPVTLSYHGAGNKVQDIASNVGLGFVLNAGGVVTRVMRGLPDESPSGYQYKGKMVSSGKADSVYLNATINNKIDGEPDMFYFNFLGHAGKMVVDTLGNAQYLPDQGIRVIRHPIHNNPDSVRNAWVLKDLNGTTYVFGSDTTSQEMTVVNITGRPPSQAITYVSSWYLSKVITADGKETASFHYSSGSGMSYTQYRNITTYDIYYDCTDKRKGIFSGKVIHTETRSARDVVKIDVNTIIQVPSPKYLSDIQNDMGSVTFSYNSRQDLIGGRALYQIKLYSATDGTLPLKTYTFNENYFLSPKPNNATDPDSKRLRLDCVTLQGRSAETKQLYAFAYNQQTLLPPRNSEEFDHWGYYTTLDDRAGYPPVNLTTDKYGNYDDGFERRVPDSSRIKACILTKVRNVNGGFTNFSYAINDYQYNGGKYTGGGLRIKSITESDSLGQVVPLKKQFSYLQDDGTSSGMIYNPKPYYIQGITNYEQNTLVKPIPSLLSYEVKNLKKPLTIIGTAASVALTVAGLSNPIGLAIDAGITVLAPAIADVFQFLFHRTNHSHYSSPPFSLSSTPLNNLFDINGSSVTYSQVAVINGDGGKIVNSYTSQREYPDSSSSFVLNYLAQQVKNIYGNTGSYPPSTSFDFQRGLLKQSKAYDNTNKLVSMVTNTYQLGKRVSAVAGQRSSVSGYAALTNGGFQVITYNVGFYQEVSQNIQLTKSVTQLFDQTTSGSSLVTTHNYTWVPNYPTLLHSESTLRSDGKLLVNYLTYPMEYARGTVFLDDMVSHGMLAASIEKVSTLQDGTSISILGGVVSRYKNGGLGLLDTVFSLSASKPIPQANFKFSNQAKGILGGGYGTFSADKNYIAKAFYQAYDSKNNLIQLQNTGEPPASIIWGYNQDVPVAKVSNATIGKIAYTSFETNDQQYWLFSAAGRDSSSRAKTGKVRYQLSSGTVTTKVSLPAGTYLLSVWAQGSKPVINGTTADAAIVNGESDNHSWNFYMDRITVAGGSPVSLTGSGFIDELRLYPQNAHMATSTFTPQLGISSVSSQDDKVKTYEYDALQRIKTERDDQYNILKEYKYSNVPQVSCTGIADDIWTGINPICYTDQNNVVPNASNYSAFASNNYGSLVCNFTRPASESAYLAKVNFTLSFTDKTTYSNSILIKSGDLSTLMSPPLTGKSAEAISGIGIDTVINLSNDYAVSYQRYQNRQRQRDSYIEANTQSGGLGTYIPPVRSAAGCALLFTNGAQTGFHKNDCSNGNGSVVDYTVSAGTYTASSQFKADSTARAFGQAYANTNGNCTAVDTSFVGIDPYCITGTVDSGTPALSAYSMVINNIPQSNILSATISRSSAEAGHDATIAYTLSFNDGSTASYTTPMYKGLPSVTISPPLIGYGAGSVKSIVVSNVTYSALNRLAYTNRKRLLNGVADGYQETNSQGTYYLAPIENPGACKIWFYNTAQTGFYRNDCLGGAPGTAVSYTVAARTDSSMVSQSYADALARARGQVYVNSTGGCYVGQFMVTTYAGSGQPGIQNGNSSNAQFTYPNSSAIDGSGNLYITDGTGYHSTMIRKITPEGVVSTLAGDTTGGYQDGVGTAARFGLNISGLITDAMGNIYATDNGNNNVRKIAPNGVVSTFAGGVPYCYGCQQGQFGYVDGQGTSARFNFLGGITIDISGSLYVLDLGRIRKITPDGLVSTFAGNGTNGYVDGPVGSAEFNFDFTTGSAAFTVDKSGIMYVYDNGRIRKISEGTVSTLAGDGSHDLADGVGASAKLGNIYQMTTDVEGNIYCTDYTFNCIRVITPNGTVTTFTPRLNTKGGGYVNGSLSNAYFLGIRSIVIDSTGNIYVNDTDNHVIRKITPSH